MPASSQDRARRLHPFLDRGADRRERPPPSRRAGGLLLVAVEPAALGDRLRWEKSRGGDLFPHVYGTIDPAESAWVKPLPLGADGAHVFPALACR